MFRKPKTTTTRESLASVVKPDGFCEFGMCALPLHVSQDSGYDLQPMECAPSALAKAGSGPELGTWRGFWLGAGKRLRRRRRSRPDFFWQRLIFQEQLQLHRVEDFSFQQCGRDTLKSVAVVLQNGACTLVAGSHDAPDLLVNVNRCVFRIGAVLRDFAAEEDGFFLFAKGQRPERTHPPIADHFPGDLRGAFDVIACARGDVA